VNWRIDSNQESEYANLLHVIWDVQLCSAAQFVHFLSMGVHFYCW